MFEDRTGDVLLSEMLADVGSAVDRREGSLIYDALAPAALRLAEFYQALDKVLENGFADTAGREYLILRARERGIEPYAASAAVGLGRISGTAAVGSRLMCDNFCWEVTELLADGECYLQCETVGSAPNHTLGRLVPVEYMSGLGTAELVDIIIPGRDEEGTEALRERYINSLTEQSFGGNRADYIEKTMSVDGVGGVRVYPAWAGGGTVRIAVCDADYGVPSDELVALVQQTLDPVDGQGAGLGLAPIGHIVTVQGAAVTGVAIGMDVVLSDGKSWTDVQQTVEESIDAYLHEVAAGWTANEVLVVRISQIEARLLALDGIVDIGRVTLNGAAENLLLNEDNVPVRGEMDVRIG